MALINAWSVSRVLGTVLFAAVLPLVVLALGLSWFVEHPRFVGAQPNPDFHTLHVRSEQAQQSSFERLSYRDLAELEPRLVGQSLLTAHARSHQVTVDADASSHRLRVAMVAGPLFEVLGVPLIGDIATPGVAEGLPGGGDKVVVVSERLARQVFGSASAALGEILHAPDLSSVVPLRTQAYRIAAVVAGPFVGPWSDDPVDAWVPLSAWNELEWPTHQFNQLLDTQVDFLGVRAQRPIADLSHAINSTLSEIAPDRGLQVMVLPGLGPAPAQRLVLGEWSSVLKTGATVLALGLGLVCFSLRWLAIERRRHDDFIRATLGERTASWWWRQLRLVMADILLLTLVACCFSALLWFLGDRFSGLPVREAMSSAARASLVLGLFIAIAAVYLLPTLVCGLQRRASQARGRSFSRYLSLTSNALVLVAAGGTAVAALIAGLTVARSDALLQRDLGIASTQIAVAELAPRARDVRTLGLHTLDPRPISLLLPASQEPRVFALASAAPLELPYTTHGQVLAESRERSGRFLLNEVSGNYFDVLAIEPLWSCSAFEDTPREQVWVNAAFQAQYLDGGAAGSAQLRLQVGGESVRHQSLVLCGVVPDFHYGNARGAAVPMIYRRMERVGGANAVIFSGPNWAADAGQFAARLAGVYPDLQLSPPRLVSSVIAEQLAEERGMALMATLVFVMVIALTVLLTAYVVGVTALLQFHVLAIRWAVGAQRLRLLASVLYGKNAWVYPTGLGVIVIVCIKLTGTVPGGEGSVSAGLLLTCLGAAAGSVLLGLLPVLYSLRDEALIKHLAARD